MLKPIPYLQHHREYVQIVSRKEHICSTCFIGDVCKYRYRLEVSCSTSKDFNTHLAEQAETIFGKTCATCERFTHCDRLGYCKTEETRKQLIAQETVFEKAYMEWCSLYTD